MISNKKTQREGEVERGHTDVTVTDRISLFVTRLVKG
jgi:hypothetical protein